MTKKGKEKLHAKKKGRWVAFQIVMTLHMLGEIQLISIIKGATNKINNIAQIRTDQIISQGGKEIERVLPRILRGAIEGIYQTPFRLLRNI